MCGCVVRNRTIVHFFSNEIEEIWSGWKGRGSGVIHSRVHKKGVLGYDGSGPNISRSLQVV